VSTPTEPSRGVPRSSLLHWPEMTAWLATAALVALDTGDALGRALRALVDWRESNIGDPWPTVVAATRLFARFQAPVYDDFDAKGSSFIYPPIAALPYAFVAGKSYEAAHHALSLASRGAWLLCVALAGALAWNGRRAIASAAFVAVGAMGMYPLLRAVELNQSTLLVSVLVGASLLLAAHRRDAAAGAVFALAAAFKPQLAVVVALVALRSRRFAIGGAATLAGLGLVSLAFGGIANHVRYVTTVLPPLSGGYAFYPNQSWNGLFLRLSGASPFDFALPHASPSVRTTSAAAALATLALGVLVLRGTRSARRAEPGLALIVAFAWIVVTLASPVSWEHHYAPALFVFAILFRNADSIPSRARALACVSFPLIAGYIDVRGFGGVLGHLAMSYGMLGGWLLAAALAKTITAPEAGSARPASPAESAAGNARETSARGQIPAPQRAP
jgi:hypothetical protein